VSTPNKEQIYDAEIYPLMAQIIAICHKNKISMFATYDIPNDEDASLVCTTCLADESGKPSERIREYNRIAVRTSHAVMLTTTAENGGKTITSFLG
jgi:hypothetical protein